MNLFRSEEHVKRWSQYYVGGEDYIMSVEDWAEVFSGPLFRNRLEPDYMVHGSEYLVEYHAAFERVGKASPILQNAIVEEMDEIHLQRYRIVGNYARYEVDVLNALKDAKNNIVGGLKTAGTRRDNHLIWAAPGTGKTFFVQEIAKLLKDECSYKELNLAKVTEDGFRQDLDRLLESEKTWLCLLDEIDSQPEALWPYELLLPYLDAASEGKSKVVYVMAGSSGFSLEGMKQRIGVRPKGMDLLSRIPTENQFLIPPTSFGDRILIVLSQLVRAGKDKDRPIRAVEKLGLYYIALSPALSNARQLNEFALRAVERVPRGDDRVKYDHLFSPGDPENKRFWLEVSSAAQSLVSSYVIIEQ